MELSNYGRSIHQAYPNLSIHHIQLYNHDGQFNDLILVNDELIFRFPRYPDYIPALTTEHCILQTIHGRLPLPTPNPLYANLQPAEPGHTFIGYPLLPGQPLWRETMAAVQDEATIQRFAAQLANFLHQLHTLPTADLHLPIQDGRDQWAQLYTDFRHHLFPRMRPDAQTAMHHHFEAYLDNPHLHNYIPALRHGDFGGSNILHDPAQGVITGILDFGFAGLGDPAIDIAAISSYGQPFLTHFIPAYPGLDEIILARAHFYKGTYALQEALHGLLHNDPEAYQSGIATYL
jgi:aminoglycoside 2''-phosphotransferase